MPCIWHNTESTQSLSAGRWDVHYTLTPTQKYKGVGFILVHLTNTNTTFFILKILNIYLFPFLLTHIPQTLSWLSIYHLLSSFFFFSCKSNCYLTIMLALAYDWEKMQCICKIKNSNRSKVAKIQNSVCRSRLHWHTMHYRMCSIIPSRIRLGPTLIHIKLRTIWQGKCLSALWDCQ